MSVLERCLYCKLKPVFDVFTRYIVEKKNWISRRKCEMVIRCRDRVVSRDSKIWVKLLSFGLELINRQVLYDKMVMMQLYLNFKQGPIHQHHSRYPEGPCINNIFYGDWDGDWEHNPSWFVYHRTPLKNTSVKCGYPE